MEVRIALVEPILFECNTGTSNISQPFTWIPLGKNLTHLLMTTFVKNLQIGMWLQEMSKYSQKYRSDYFFRTCLTVKPSMLS